MMQESVGWPQGLRQKTQGDRFVDKEFYFGHIEFEDLCIFPCGAVL